MEVNERNTAVNELDEALQSVVVSSVMGDIDGNQFVSIAVLSEEYNELAESDITTEGIHSEPKFTYNVKSIRRVDSQGNTPEVLTTTLGSEPVVFNAFESAVDDWYAKLSVHRPLEDCEILESAQQLAIHFHVAYDVNAEWLSAFKIRHEQRRTRVENVGTIRAVPVSTLGYESILGKRRGSPDLQVSKRPKESAQPIATIPPKIGVTDVVVKDIDNIKQEIDIVFKQENDTESLFESQLLAWYFSLTSQLKIMVSPSIFESKSVEIALSLGMAHFRPAKMWLKSFLGRYGMWCTLGRQQRLFLAPAAGIIKRRFDMEFELWYHAFPVAPELLLDCMRPYIFDYEKGKIKQYLAEIFKWFTTQTRVVSVAEIESMEAKIAGETNMQKIDVEGLEKFYVTWVKRLENFLKGVEQAYILSLPVMVPQVLEAVSRQQARKMGLYGFSPHPTWMRRYLQLNGLLYHDGEFVHCYMLDAKHCPPDDFDRVCRVWLASSVSCTEHLRRALRALLPANVVPDPSLRGGRKLTERGPLKCER